MRRNNKSFLDKDSLDSTIHNIRGGGILASAKELGVSDKEFSAGCLLLLAAARGDQGMFDGLLKAHSIVGIIDVNFRDYDRRTSLHIAASEGNLPMCIYLIGLGAKVNRSDRWGGSPLDDALRHRQKEVAKYLRSNGGRTGNADKTTSLITAACEGDLDEIVLLLEDSPATINKGDYDSRTALHLAAGEGHLEVLKYLIGIAGCNINVEDRFGGRPLDDAKRNKHTNCVQLLLENGAKYNSKKGMDPNNDSPLSMDDSGHELDKSSGLKNSMHVDWTDLEMIDKIGAGEFGEIYKCKWRGSMVAAKCVKSAKIRTEWMKRTNKNTDELCDSISTTAKDRAMVDFRIETQILSQLRHPNICMLLGYSTSKDYEVMISELATCSLLDVFNAHRVNGTKISKKKQLRYAIELAKGMNYLHTCRPPILHRDLKPANLLLDFRDTLKITDFGLAKLRPTKKVGEESMETDKFIMTGETGSYRFMAPEVFRHESYNETVDVYSFAMILYNLLLGHPPWPALNGVKACALAAMEGERPTIPRDVDKDLSELMQQCWHEVPTNRLPFESVLETLNNNFVSVFRISVDEQTKKDVDKVDGTCCAVM